MTDIEKIAYAKTFIDKMANGINPLDDSPIPEGDLLKQARISRCLFFVSERLGEMCNADTREKNESKGTRREERELFHVTDEVLSNFPFSETPITISVIINYFNSAMNSSTMDRLPIVSASRWLRRNGYLEKVVDENGKKSTILTDKGKEVGLMHELTTTRYGRYVMSVMCDINGQKFIVEHLNDIINYYYEWKEEGNQKKREKYVNHGKPWTDEDNTKLIDLYCDGLVITEIAKTLQRTPGGIITRLKYLGVVGNGNKLIW